MVMIATQIAPMKFLCCILLAVAMARVSAESLFIQKNARVLRGGVRPTLHVPLSASAINASSSSPAWRHVLEHVFINASEVRIWQDLPLPPAINALITTGEIDPAIVNDTAVCVNGTCTPAATCNNAGNPCGGIKHARTQLQHSRRALLQQTTQSGHVRVLRHEVTDQGNGYHHGRKHVMEMSTITGTCGVTAGFLSYQTASLTEGRLTLLFNSFSAETTDMYLGKTLSCAFRIPIQVPFGVSVTLLSSKLDGYAKTSTKGSVSVTWLASLDRSGLAAGAWAYFNNTDAYSTRKWLGDTSEPFSMTVLGELDAQRDCDSQQQQQQQQQSRVYTYPVTLQFQLTLHAEKGTFEAKQKSSIRLDTQDTLYHVQFPLKFLPC